MTGAAATASGVAREASGVRARQSELDLLHLQRPPPDQIPHARLHTVETAQNHYGPLQAGGDPALGRFEIGQDLVEASRRSATT